MKYWRISGSAGFCGTDFEEVICAETREEAEDRAIELCQRNLESYEYLVLGWDNTPEDCGLIEEEYEEEIAAYYESGEWHITEISKEEYEEEIE